MLKGFQREAECLDDESIDVPGAKESFQKLVEDARDQGWLDPHFSLEAAMVEARASAGEWLTVIVVVTVIGVQLGDFRVGGVGEGRRWWRPGRARVSTWGGEFEYEWVGEG